MPAPLNAESTLKDNGYEITHSAALHHQRHQVRLEDPVV